MLHWAIPAQAFEQGSARARELIASGAGCLVQRLAGLVSEDQRPREASARHPRSLVETRDPEDKSRRHMI